jgi:hypothetical protein
MHVFIWPLLTLLVGSIVWHTRGRHARMRRLRAAEREADRKALSP